MTDAPRDAKGGTDAKAPPAPEEERRADPGEDGEPRLRRAEDELRARFAEELEESEEAQERIGVSKEAIVELDDVSLAFDRPILEHVSFVARRGETIVIAGESGTGKSTILKLILRLLRPDSGRVIVDGEVLNDVTYEEALVIRQKMGMVFQGAALFDSMSVFENIAFPLREHTTLSEDEIEARVREKLDFVDLEPDRVMDQLPAELSGGMKKRVGIARGMAVNPAIMLYDEPTSGLDPLTTGTITRLIMKLQRELKVTSVVVSHDIRSAFRMATKIALLAEKKIVFFGSPEEMTASQDRYVQDFLGGV
ncbi:MAG: ATP-binding cassette domain-containing protein [Gemmatimonadota bacterium]|nr:ATP-binding cassette domain-containing protein [Gemmatimonadota bacterium]